MEIANIHGHACVRVNGRYFPIKLREQRNDIAQRIHEQSHSTGNYWDRVQRLPKSARVIINQR